MLDNNNQQPQPIEPKIDIPVSSEELQQAPKWATGEAEREERGWDDLETVRKQNDVRWLAVYGWVLLVLTIAFAATFVLALLAWAFHYLAPVCWHWLTDPQLSKIQSVLFSGGMGAVISAIIRGQLGKAQS